MEMDSVCLADWIILRSKIFLGRGGWGNEVKVAINQFPSLTCQILTYLYKDSEKHTNEETLNTTRKQQQSHVRWRPQIVFAEKRASKLNISMQH